MQNIVTPKSPADRALELVGKIVAFERDGSTHIGKLSRAERDLRYYRDALGFRVEALGLHGYFGSFTMDVPESLWATIREATAGEVFSAAVGQIAEARKAGMEEVWSSIDRLRNGED
jgi:hypothetical protein